MTEVLYSMTHAASADDAADAESAAAAMRAYQLEQELYEQVQINPWCSRTTHSRRWNH